MKSLFNKLRNITTGAAMLAAPFAAVAEVSDNWEERAHIKAMNYVEDLENPRISMGVTLGKDSTSKSIEEWDRIFTKMLGQGEVFLEYDEDLKTTTICIYSTAKDNKGKAYSEVYGPCVLNVPMLQKHIADATEFKRYMIASMLDNKLSSLER